MAFSSSPVLYPQSSSPPAISQKRKLFQSLEPTKVSPKRTKLLGGFICNEESDDEEEAFPTTTVVRTVASGSSERQSFDRLCGPAPPEDKRANALEVEESTGTTHPRLPSSTSFSFSRLTPKTTTILMSNGAKHLVSRRPKETQKSYEQIIAQRSITEPGRGRKSYYGVDIHQLMDEARIQKELKDAAADYRKENEAIETIEKPLQPPERCPKSNAHQMWTEKYRAKKFTDLVGDERTHRSVLRWLKSWDTVVFPGNSKTKARKIYDDQEQLHKKILLLTGPPGLGKTTLAHVCAKQAGYEVLEINASDDRSRDVVKGRIKDCLGTETVRGIQEHGKARRAGRPVCVVVDEVDGVVTGSGGSGGEGGFMKALIDLVQLDQRNSNSQQGLAKGTKKGDRFRLLRPLILICNDVYAPSLRPLRQSSIAEIVHVRKPAIDKVIPRLISIFQKENIGCDNDAVRRLCESSWGLGTRKQNSLGGRGAGDGDIRGVLVQGEWMAHKLRASKEGSHRLTRKWVEEHISNSTATQDGLGRGGVREVVDRIFVEGAGLPNLPTALNQDEARLVAESKSNPVGVADLRKRAAISALRGMIDTTGDHDRLMTDCFTTYPTQVFQDDTVLSKPNAGYEWLHFHDRLSSRIFSGQEWELNPYLSTSACGFHDLFASVDKGSKGWNDDKNHKDESDSNAHPFSGSKADFAAYEAEKANRATLNEMQAGFSAPLLRLFSSTDTIAMDLVPNVSRILAPDIKPVVVGGSGSITSVASVRKESEKHCVQTVVRVMYALGVQFEKVKIESEGLGAHANGGYALRMEPPIDSLSTFHISKPALTGPNSTGATKTTSTATAPVRYAVRQVLSQELWKEKALQANLSRQARGAGLSAAALSNHPYASSSVHYNEDGNDDKENNPPLGIKNIVQITAIAAATATLSSAPGSATLLNTGPIKKDFFGRPITVVPTAARPGSRGGQDAIEAVKGHHRRQSSVAGGKSTKVNDMTVSSSGERTWVSFHEGYSNAVRKYISLKELMDGF